MTSLKKHSFGEPARPTKNIAVLGAGLMGAGIAQISAEKGYRVLLKDKTDEGIANGEKYINGNWDKKLKRKVRGGGGGGLKAGGAEPGGGGRAAATTPHAHTLRGPNNAKYQPLLVSLATSSLARRSA